jgi:DNA-binding response OmpR family regulator
MVKPQISSSHGLDRQHVSAENDRLEQAPMLDTQGQRKRILVVDDNSDIAFTLQLGLENGDKTIQVSRYDNPVKALADFEPNFYDLLLVDINMPLMKCQKLLQKDINLKVCFMTSGEINMDAVREVHPLKSIGCFIKKSIATETLVRRIRAELE